MTATIDTRPETDRPALVQPWNNAEHIAHRKRVVRSKPYRDELNAIGSVLNALLGFFQGEL